MYLLISNFIDSVFRTGDSYYPQMFLEECKHVATEKKMSKYIIKDIEISSDSDKETSDEENSNEENSDKNTKKNSEKKHVTDIKIFLKKKKTKGKKRPGKIKFYLRQKRKKSSVLSGT